MATVVLRAQSGAWRGLVVMLRVLKLHFRLNLFKSNLNLNSTLDILFSFN